MSQLFPLGVGWLLGAGLLLVDGRKRVVAVVTVLTLGSILALDLWLLAIQIQTGQVAEVVTGGWPPGVGIRLHVDDTSLFFGAVSALCLTVVMVHETVVGVSGRLFPALVVLLCAALHGAFFTGDLFNFYVFFELSLVSSFALAAYGYGRAELRATFTYVVVNLFGSVLFLVGVAGVYHAAGTVDFVQLSAVAGTAEVGTLLIPATLLLSALLLKLGLFPFHGWVPVLYTHARPAVAAAMSGALVNVGAYGLARIGFTALPEARAQASDALVTLGLVAGLYGAVLALRRSRPAEIVAYTAIAQAGLIVMAFGVGGTLGMMALTFTVLAGSLDKTTMLLSVEARGTPGSVATFIAVMGASGMPLTAGFLEKVQLFRAALAHPASALAAIGLGLVVTGLIVALLRFWRLCGSRTEARASGYPALVLASVSVAVAIAAAPLTRIVADLSARITGGSP